MRATQNQPPLLIHAGRVALPGGMLKDGVVLVQDGCIVSVGRRGDYGDSLGEFAGATVLECPALTLAPGFIDLHTHGGGGKDPISGDPDALEVMATFYASHGVTGFLASAWGTQPQIERAIDLALQFSANPAPNGAAMLGIYLEGPFLSPQWPGAFQPQSILPPNAALFAAWIERAQSHLRLVTFAPELPGAQEIVEIAQRNNLVSAAGHTGATYEQIVEASGWGVRHATHMFNAMSPLHHRAPGTVGAILADAEYTAEIIADGIHVHPAVVRMLIDLKGPNKVALITDSIRAAGLPDGVYGMEDGGIVVANGSARLPNGTLAGSMLTMDRAVANVIDFAGVNLSDALIMASATPAAILGVGDRKGAIVQGMDADLVLLDEDLQIACTIVGGRIVYRVAGFAEAAEFAEVGGG